MAVGWMVAALMASLHGTTWAGPANAPVKITFEEGHAYGKLSCNTFRTRYDADGQTIGFGGIITTRMGCAPDRMAEERLVLSFLEQTHSYALEGDTLVLKDKAGNALIRLVKA